MKRIVCVVLAVIVIAVAEMPVYAVEGHHHNYTRYYYQPLRYRNMTEHWDGHEVTARRIGVCCCGQELVLETVTYSERCDFQYDSGIQGPRCIKCGKWLMPAV